MMSKTHTVEIETPFGPVRATWVRKGRMIEIAYGARMKREVASPNDATNDLVARDALRAWVREDIADE